MTRRNAVLQCAIAAMCLAGTACSGLSVSPAEPDAAPRPAGSPAVSASEPPPVAEAPSPAPAPQTPASESSPAVPATPTPATPPPVANRVPPAPPPQAQSSTAPTAPARPRAANEPPAAAPAPVAPAAPATPSASAAPVPALATLDFASLGTRLRETKAIGVLTKLSVKNQADDLLEKFRAYHNRESVVALADLRSSYDLLVLKILSLVQDGDPPLAREIDRSRAAIWSILADQRKFIESNLMSGA